MVPSPGSEKLKLARLSLGIFHMHEGDALGQRLERIAAVQFLQLKMAEVIRRGQPGIIDLRQHPRQLFRPSESRWKCGLLRPISLRPAASLSPTPQPIDKLLLHRFPLAPVCRRARFRPVVDRWNSNCAQLPPRLSVDAGCCDVSFRRQAAAGFPSMRGESQFVFFQTSEKFFLHRSRKFRRVRGPISEHRQLDYSDSQSPRTAASASLSASVFMPYKLKPRQRAAFHLFRGKCRAHLRDSRKCTRGCQPFAAQTRFRVADHRFLS